MAVATLPKVRGQKTDWATPEYGVCTWPSRRFTVDEYHRLDELEIFHPDEKCELLYGWITEKNPPSPAWKVEGNWADVEIWPYPIRKFTVEEYELLISAGFFDGQHGQELIEGWITPKMPIDPRHTFGVLALTYLLMARLPRGWIVRPQQPIRGAISLPEPDLSIVEGELTDFLAGHPLPAQAEVLIEVSNTSLAFDRDSKLKSYARMKIAQYWVVNLIDMRVEVYTLPRGGKSPTYKSRLDYVNGEEIPLVLAGKSVGSLPVSEFLA